MATSHQLPGTTSGDLVLAQHQLEPVDQLRQG